MKKKMVGEVPGNVLGMLADLALKLQNGNITPDQFGKFLKKENPFKIGNYSSEISDWQNFWQGITGKEYDFSKIIIPEKSEGKWQLLIAIDITLETLYAKCKEKFSCWRWTNDNFDKLVTKNERNAKNGAYAIWVQDDAEADEDLKNLSANAVKTEGITTETLAERLIHELKFFSETGRHLDIRNITLCTGSRCCDGNVPFVSWNGVGRLIVHWHDPAHVSGSLRARRVVS